ncbi:MAG: IclR family transcriptional regulator [Gemmatirosa sp.]|nr:IclR family transcriptional regulator [Gemmatirosa sp.]
MKQRFTADRDGPAPGTQAVRRAAAILRALGGPAQDLGLSEIAAEVHLHKTTVFRLLDALEHEELVVRDHARETYRLGPELVALGNRARRAVGLHAAARPELVALARVTGETATLEVLVGDEVLILDEVFGRFLIGSRPELGMRFPAYAASTGKVLLAARMEPVHRAQRDAQRSARRDALPQLAPNTITSRVRLARELADVRRQGFATAFEEIEPGYAAVGAPVVDADGRAVAAISVGGPTTRLTRERLLALAPTVRAAAARIGRHLGAPLPLSIAE